MLRILVQASDLSVFGAGQNLLPIVFCDGLAHYPGMHFNVCPFPKSLLQNLTLGTRWIFELQFQSHILSSMYQPPAICPSK